MLSRAATVPSRKRFEQALVSGGHDFAVLRVGKTFAEASDVSRQRGFIPVGRMSGLRLLALKQRRALPDLIRGLLASWMRRAAVC